MASTTEELTGQSEQLVSALSFFRTDDEEDAAARRPVQKTAKPHAPSVKPNPKPNGLGLSAGVKHGVSLRMKDRQDELDGEFERY
jgi:methyl-accepting chemotaxis protein